MASDPVLDSDLTAIVAAAVRAPSVHNTQPWRWEGRVDRLDLYADRSRQLRVLDPQGRALHLSCGAALLHARVAAGAAGYRAEVRLLPDAGRPDHLASLTLARSEPDDDAARLAAAISRRHTQRDPFSGPLADDALRRLRQAAAAEEATLHPVTDSADVTALALLIAHADEAERSDPAYREELATWLRPAGSSADDGVPVEALPHPSPGTWVTALQPRDFQAAAPPTPSGGEPPAVEHPLAAILVTEYDDPGSWLRAGQALGRVLLELTDAGGAAQPLTQPVEVASYRQQMRTQLRLLGYPQMVLRLGATSETTETPRRSVDQVLNRDR